MKLQKSNLVDSQHCRNKNCKECGMSDFYGGYSAVTCMKLVANDALQLLSRVEKLEQLLRDVLASGNVKSCEREIREVLEGTK